MHARFWLPSKSLGSGKDVASSILAGKARRFLLRLHLREGESAPPMVAVFAFEGLGAPAWQPGSLVFSWTRCGGFPLPSMRGELFVRRLGPFTSVFVRADYAYDDGPAGRLFHEAVGDALARNVFRKLVNVVKHIVSHRDERPLVVPGEPRTAR